MQLGSYDPSRPLVIDPGLAYSTFVGGESIAADSLGYAYVTGGTESGNFPTTPVRLKVRNADATESAEFFFTRP